MAKNLWQRERNNIFRDLVKQYVEEGYDSKEAKRLSKRELDEIMEVLWLISSWTSFFVEKTSTIVGKRPLVKIKFHTRLT